MSVQLSVPKFFLLMTTVLQIVFFSSSSQAVFIPELPVKVSKAQKDYVTNKLKSKWVENSLFSEEEKKILIADLSALYVLTGEHVNSSLYKEIFRTDNFDGKVLFEWIVNKFQSIAPSLGSTCGKIKEIDHQACYAPIEKKIKLTPSFFNSDRIHRLSNLIHEARHTEGYTHAPGTQDSSDNIINGARGAEWTFLTTLASSCNNCFLTDKVSAFKYAIDILAQIKNLSSSDLTRYSQEQRLVQDPLKKSYEATVKQLMDEDHSRKYVYFMPSICLNAIPFNEFNGDVANAQIVDCILASHLVDETSAKANPNLLHRGYLARNGFLIVLIPIEKKNNVQ